MCVKQFESLRIKATVHPDKPHLQRRLEGIRNHGGLRSDHDKHPSPNVAGSKLTTTLPCRVNTHVV